MAIGRNEPCPCGSTKKYKKCCLVTTLQSQQADHKYSGLRESEHRLTMRLLRYAAEMFGLEILQEAWKAFHNDEPPYALDLKSPMNQLFMPWFLFNWTQSSAAETTKLSLAPNTTVAESFLKAYAQSLSDTEKMLLAAANRCPFSLYEANEVRPGSGMTLRNLLCPATFDVVEIKASKTIQRGHILYCAIMHFGNDKVCSALSPVALPPIYKRDFLKLRQMLIKAIDDKTLTAVHLRTHENAIRQFYFDTMDAYQNSPSAIFNTNNDPLQHDEDASNVTVPYNELPPEAQAALQKMQQKHWQSWYDTPIPALNDKTPRQAAKTVEGRDLLESLLLYYEQQESQVPDNLIGANIPTLRATLGL